MFRLCGEMIGYTIEVLGVGSLRPMDRDGYQGANMVKEIGLWAVEYD